MEHRPTSPLPPVRSLPRPAQYRLLALALLALVAIVVAAKLLGWLLTPAPVAEPALPPGTFRPTPEQRAALQTEVVAPRGQDQVVAATGTIGVDEDRSTPVLMPYSGQVSQVLVEAGEMVRQGQSLLTIRTGDVVDARNALLTARANVGTTAATLRTAQANVGRQEQIYRTAGGALRDYQQAQTDFAAAQAGARSAEAALGAARDRLVILGKSPAEIAAMERAPVATIQAETTLRAPISGLVSQRAVSPGQYVGAGGDKPVMTISDPTHLWLVAQLAESDAASVRVGDPVQVRTPAYPGRTFVAKIDNVAAQLDPTSHRLPVRASIYDPDRALKPQMFASFSILRPGLGAQILLPAAAIIHEGDAARVWVVRPDGLLASRQIRLGDETAGQVRVLAGLTAGERVVTAGALFVNEAGVGE